MLSSISPLGERARGSRWWLTTTAYVVGSLAGGALIGVVAGAIGAVLALPARAVFGSATVLVGALVVAAAFLLGLAVDTGRVGRGLPSWQRQVDEQWLTRYRGWVYGVGFGLQLGLGVVTIVPSSTTYAMLAAAALTANPAAGALVGAVFGLVRALPALVVARVEEPAQLHDLFRRLQAWATPADRMARASLAVGALLAVTLALVPLAR
ncbi:urease accessory protein UreH domain-containing protein [Piscicoccus intestinalis]|uniref:urease accessory protein UreH domain-containing protein n=1 Tax=Piscicoccus intestinalis TaxID=746033 RepID=UPI000837D77C|nr:sulfite exporter TauE/SafE family protein [Piscicoccus intestinalis]